MFIPTSKTIFSHHFHHTLKHTQPVPTFEAPSPHTWQRFLPTRHGHRGARGHLRAVAREFGGDLAGEPGHLGQMCQKWIQALGVLGDFWT